MTRDTAERGEIIRVLVGSTTHGLALEGKDDRDEMGVTIEPIREGMGLFAVGPVAHFIYRSAAEREGKNDAPSQPGDLDLTIYTLRKFLHLVVCAEGTMA